MLNCKKIVAFDLDDVICSRPPDINNAGISKYAMCEPNYEIINIVNQCYYKYIVKIYTARGMNQFNGDTAKVYDKIYTFTKTQLSLWGVLHDELIMGKAHYDLLIDDKALNSVNIKAIKDVENFINKT